MEVFKIEPATRRNKNQCRKVLHCKQKTYTVYKNKKLNRRLNRVGRPITKWVVTK